MFPNFIILFYPTHFFVDIHHTCSISRPYKSTFLASLKNHERFYIYQETMGHRKASVVRIEELDDIKSPRFDYVNGLFCFWITSVIPHVFKL